MAPGVAFSSPTACTRHGVPEARQRAGVASLPVHFLQVDVRMCLAGEACARVASNLLRAWVDDSMCLRITNKLRELLRSCWAPGEDIQRPTTSPCRQSDGWDIRLAPAFPTYGAAASPALFRLAIRLARPFRNPHRSACSMNAWRWIDVHASRVGHRAGAHVRLLRPGRRCEPLPAAAVCGPLALACTWELRYPGEAPGLWSTPPTPPVGRLA